MNRNHVAENDAERERLRSLVAGLSDEELSRPMPGGLTVAAVLAHAGFWDGRVIALIDKWDGGLDPSSEDAEPDEVAWINDAVRPLSLALPVRDAAQLTLQLAEEADARVAALSDDMLAKIVEVGTIFSLSRGNHRREHLDDIEQALKN